MFRIERDEVGHFYKLIHGKQSGVKSWKVHNEVNQEKTRIGRAIMRSF